MKPDITTLKDSFRLSREVYKSSIKEYLAVKDAYNGKHYTQQQLAELANRGQPAESFNVIKLFVRSLQGYFSSLNSNIKVMANKQDEELTAKAVSLTIQNILDRNDYTEIKEDLEKDFYLAGLQIIAEKVLWTEEVDEYGRHIHQAYLERIRPETVALDPKAIQPDYSDARFLHHYRWLHEDDAELLFGEKVKKLEAYYNHLNQEDSEYTRTYGPEWHGEFKTYDEYLIVHSVVRDKDKIWSIYWSGDVILSKEEVAFFPYRVNKLEDEPNEFFGLFRDVIESQKAINQALLKVQLLVNTNKVLVENDAVEDVEQFRVDVAKVNAILQVNYLAGVKFENVSADVGQQYTIISRALDRIKQILHINDAFLGMAMASESGKKTEIQRFGSIQALRYLTSKFNFFTKKLGYDLVNLINLYYNANMMIPYFDEKLGRQWLEVNKPITEPTNEEPYYDYIEDVDGSFKLDSDGKYSIEYLNDPDSDLNIHDYDITVETINYGEEEDADKLLLDQVINGAVGSALLKTNPAKFFQISALRAKALSTKHSQEIGDILMEVAMALQPQAPQVDPRMVEGMAGAQLPQQGGGAIAHTMGLSNRVDSQMANTRGGANGSK